jgi:hypothetical protein
VDRLDVYDKAINLSPHVLQLFLVVVSCQTKTDTNTGVEQFTKALKLMLLSNSYLFLPCIQGRPATNRWNSQKIGGAIAAKQNLLVVGICGALGRLHSSQGLAHSNNNAKLNDSAKYETNVVGNK